MPRLTLPNASALALSVRAKALVFEDPRSKRRQGQIRDFVQEQRAAESARESY